MPPVTADAGKSFVVTTPTGDLRFLHTSEIGYFRYQSGRKIWEVALTNGTFLPLKRNTTAEQLCAYDTAFTQIHQSYIINLHYLIMVQDNRCIMYPPFNSLEELVVSKKYKKKMIYLENVEIHHLPSNVARVYGDERDVNIIANNYVVRKMCYPIFCIPILKLMLFLRMLKHEYYFNGYSKIINKMIKERYSVEYVDRMGISTMIKMLKDVGVAQVF